MPPRAPIIIIIIIIIIMSTKTREVHANALTGNNQQEVRNVLASTTKYDMNIQVLTLCIPLC
jgi:hypothetical protein